MTYIHQDEKATQMTGLVYLPAQMNGLAFGLSSVLSNVSEAGQLQWVYHWDVGLAWWRHRPWVMGLQQDFLNLPDSLGCSWRFSYLVTLMHSASFQYWSLLSWNCSASMLWHYLLSPVVSTEEKLPSCGHLVYGILSVSLFCRGEGECQSSDAVSWRLLKQILLHCYHVSMRLT